MGPAEFAEQIAMYHEEGMGFGVLVKLYSMAEAQIEACVNQMATSTAVAPTTQPAADSIDTTPATCEAVTIDQLVNEFRSGTGMGLLFKEYGKPALLGVGHVKKALQNQPQATPTPTVNTTPVPNTDPANVQTQTKKSNNGNGNSGSNGNDNNNGNGNGKSNPPGRKK